MREHAHGLCASTVPFYIRNFSSHGFWNQSPADTEGQLDIHNHLIPKHFHHPKREPCKPQTHSAATLLAPFPSPWQPPTRSLSLWFCLLWAFLMNVPATCRAWLLATSVWHDRSQCFPGGRRISLPGSVGGCLQVGRACLKYSPRTAAACLSIHRHRRPSSVLLQSVAFFVVFHFFEQSF